MSVIVATRDAMGLTQRELNARLNLPASFVWKLEVGEHRVDVHQYLEIARTLGVLPEKLMEKIEAELYGQSASQ